MWSEFSPASLSFRSSNFPRPGDDDPPKWVNRIAAARAPLTAGYFFPTGAQATRLPYSATRRKDSTQRRFNHGPAATVREHGGSGRAPEGEVSLASALQETPRPYKTRKRGQPERRERAVSVKRED
jgi:hypothetical protein